MAAATSAARAVGETIDFTCPSAPSGWTISSAPAFWGPAENAGGDTERITCFYQNGKNQTTSIAVEYALPDDVNPYNDFYYGCGTTGAVSWNDTQRIYQVTSNDRWLYANVADPYDLFSSSDVPRFEAVARSMVNEAHGMAHTCSLKIAPTATLAGWLFDFEMDLTGGGVVAFGGIGTHEPAAGTVAGIGSYAIPDGMLQTKGPEKHPVVASVDAPTVKITVVEHGKKLGLTIKLTKGISFAYKVPKSGVGTTASMMSAVKVVHSRVPGCAVGQQGTLFLATTPPTLKLKLCAGVFGQLRSRNPQVTILRN